MAKFISHEELSEAATKAVIDRIRDRLRDRILKALEPDVEESIDAALEAFKIDVAHLRDFTTGGDILRVLIEKRNSDG